MNATKTVCMLSVGALLAIAAPAFAERDGDRPHWTRYQRDRHEQRVVTEHRHRPAVRQHVARQPIVVERRVVVQRPVYVSRPVVVERPVYVDRPVVVERPVYIERPVAVPEPAYYSEPYGEPYYSEPVYSAPPSYPVRASNPLGTIGGAVIGAAIGSQIGHGDERTATTAIGAILGGIIGSNF